MIEKFSKQLQVGGWIFVVVLALSAVWLWNGIEEMQRSSSASETISVQGKGTVKASPDIAVADIAISVEGATAKGAQDQANVKSNAVVDYLKKTGIKDADIKTSGYNIYPQYDYNNGSSRIRGYQVTQSLTVKIRDMDKANTVVDGVVTAGANQVNSLRFEVYQPDLLKSEARKMAIDDANKKADELRDQLHIGLGKIVSFSESGDYVPPIMYGMGGGAMAKDVSVRAPDLPAGENDIVVNVTITYQIR
jgi:uncharacterized protein YggE